MKLHNVIIAFIILAAGLLFSLYARSIFVFAHYTLNTDMTLFYLSGKMLNGHTSGYAFSHEYLSAHQSTKELIANLAPPFFVMIMAIVTRYVSYTSFFFTFMSFSVLINIIALTMLYRHFFTNHTRYKFLMLLAFILANFLYVPTLMNITCGEVALVLNALVIFAYLLLQRKQYIWSSFFFALAMNIKLFFAIFFIYFLARKQYRAFFSLILFTLLLAIIPLCIYGTSVYTGYWKILNHIQWYGINWNASWLGFCARMFGESSHPFHTAMYLPLLSRWIYGVIFVFYLACVYCFSRKNVDASLSFAFTLSSMLLISPLGWSYYFPILITALLINIHWIESHRYYILFICLLMLSLFLSALPFPLYKDNKMSVMSLILQGNIFFIALLLFNATNVLQLMIPSVHKPQQILTQRYSMLILCLCLLPSMIGMSSIALSFLQGTITQPYESNSLAFNEELQPSYNS